MVSAFVFVVKLSGCYVQGNLNLLARLVTRLLDRGHDQVKCFDVATEVWSEATFVTHGGVKAFALQHLFQVVENFAAAAKCIAKTLKAQRHDHKFLYIDAIVSVFASVDDVHHRCWQQRRAGSAEVTVERLVGIHGGGFGGRQ